MLMLRPPTLALFVATAVSSAAAAAPDTAAAPTPAALFEAVAAGDLAQARMLLQRGAPADTPNPASGGSTPLMVAAASRRPDLVALLLAAGARARASDASGQTALLFAMAQPVAGAADRAAALEVMRELVEAGAAVDAPLAAGGKVPTGVTPLRIATAFDLAFVRFLLEHGADPNAMDSQGVTPLMSAVDTRWAPDDDGRAAAAVRLLVDHGAIVDAAVGGVTPLMRALYSGLPRAAATLLEAHASATARSSNGTTALMAAAHCGDLTLVERLLALGADAHAVNDDGESALGFALADHARPDAEAVDPGPLVATLLAHGADPKRPNRAGQTPLMAAARRGSLAAFDALVARGATLDGVDGHGSTLVMLAAAGGQPAVLRKVLAAHGDPRAADRDGDTALHWAAARKQADVVPLLLSTGLPVDGRNRAGQTPLDLAFDCDDEGARRIIAELVSRGADTSEALRRARRCAHSTLQQAILGAQAERAFRTSAPPEQLVALVWASTPDLDSAAPVARAAQGLADALADVLQPAPGFPRVLTETDAPGLGPGAHVVVGMCARDDAALRLELLRGLAPGLKAMPVSAELPHQACPVVLFDARGGLLDAVDTEGGGRLALARYRLERPGAPAPTRYVAIETAADGTLRGHADLEDGKFPRWCAPAQYEQWVAREPSALRLVIGCVQGARDGREVGRVVDVHRFTAQARGLIVNTLEAWTPPADAVPPPRVSPAG